MNFAVLTVFHTTSDDTANLSCSTSTAPVLC